MLQLTLTNPDTGKRTLVNIPDSFDYMILATVRAGTHWLASRLASHPELDNFGELGCREYPEWMGLRKDSGAMHGFVAHYIDCSTANHDEQFLQFNLRHLSHRPVIHLVRDPRACAESAAANVTVMDKMRENGVDPTEHYVSHFKGSEEVEEVQVDPELVSEEEKDVARYQAVFRDLLLKNNPRHIEVSYEDMKEDPEATDLRVLEFLGVEPMKLSSALRPTPRLVTLN